MTTQPIEGEVIREIELKIDAQTASIHILPKPDEINDTNVPRNLHNAAELFLRAGMVQAAEAVRDQSRALLDLYAENPDGRRAVRVGTECVCWVCGHSGLPDSEGCGGKVGAGTPGPCAGCGDRGASDVRGGEGDEKGSGFGSEEGRSGGEREESRRGEGYEGGRGGSEGGGEVDVDKLHKKRAAYILHLLP